MKNNRKNITQFLVWTRNGTAFCTTWFLILWLIASYLSNQQSLSVHKLTQMILLSLGSVIIFNLLFTQILIKKWSFTGRLTIFMLLISAYECFAFYRMDLFISRGSFTQWGIFAGIIFILYLLCIALYVRYSKRKGALYTQALKDYQQQRRIENEQ